MQLSSTGQVNKVVTYMLRDFTWIKKERREKSFLIKKKIEKKKKREFLHVKRFTKVFYCGKDISAEEKAEE